MYVAEERDGKHVVVNDETSEAHDCDSREEAEQLARTLNKLDKETRDGE